MSKKIKIALTVYAAVAVITFGHSWNQKSIPDEGKVFAAIGCAALWPLYWSVKFQEVE